MVFYLYFYLPWEEEDNAKDSFTDNFYTSMITWSVMMLSLLLLLLLMQNSTLSGYSCKNMNLNWFFCISEIRRRWKSLQNDVFVATGLRQWFLTHYTRKKFNFVSIKILEQIFLIIRRLILANTPLFALVLPIIANQIKQVENPWSIQKFFFFVQLWQTHFLARSE